MARAKRQPNVRMEFHISRQARERYQFSDSLFSLTGNVIFANFHATRVFAQRMNSRRDVVRFPEKAARAGQVAAMGLIDEILHFVLAQYRQQRDPAAIQRALEAVEAEIGDAAVALALHRFVDEFPPVAVYRRELSVEDYLNGEADGVPNRLVALEEMILLWLANANPAYAPYLELFDDSALARDTAYTQIVATLREWFRSRPPFGPDAQPLLEMLRSPAVASPHSLAGQLEYIRERWGFLLGKYLYQILGSLDMIGEEERALRLLGAGDGPGPALVYEFGGLGEEPERFSQDRDWMPRLVLVAKTVYVWLDQLSKQYHYPITRLDQIPDEELQLFARRGFTGLWLIGLWERSRASKTIKERMGNAEAVASAYSLYDYQIAADLGGEEAYEALRERAWRHGIRLASDMVPNHMGIDSRWVVEHPDWFISLDYSPYPAYTFNGPDLSGDGRVGIYLEDHYYSRSDAAVVFRRRDHATGSERYIYHGNDGTSMPWNDTAQLNYLNPEVREGVIQTILHVARKFQVIRFDAAMTLAKTHYQRLWFPEPGTGGGIPSRSEFGLTKAQFDAAMPEEFWREVVDRVAAEVPDTLLLAEAFWLMEGYFVRTLGMHRVYNSAFMNMLRDEDNAKYRQVMKNTLEFDPEIMKRYVNFMNNPDERTAVDQFGKGDKYLGVATLLATLPGLPMFGHGQVEGYAEKYGMEFRRAHWDEQPDPNLVERHERLIFPLLHRRYLFAGAENFRLYDFFTPDGTVDENVFAYSNGVNDERALVVYHNRYADTRGWVRNSVAYLDKQDGQRRLVQKNLGEGLSLRGDDDRYAIFRDQADGMEYIRNNREILERGLYVELGAYKQHVFLDFREVQDNSWRHYAHLTAYLAGRGVPSIDEALREVFLEPVHSAFANVASADLFAQLLTLRSAPSKQADDSAILTPPVEEAVGVTPADGSDALEAPSPAGLGDTRILNETEGRLLRLFGEVKQFSQGPGDPAGTAAEVSREVAAVLRLASRAADAAPPLPAAYWEAVAYVKAGLDGDRALWGTLLGWLVSHKLGKVATEAEYEQQTRTWMDEWQLGRILASGLTDFGLGDGAAWVAVATVKLLTAHERWYEQFSLEATKPYLILESWLQDGEVQQYVGINRFQGVLWFNNESLERMLWLMMLAAFVNATQGAAQASEEQAQTIAECYRVIKTIHRAAEASEYQLENLLEATKA